MSNGASEKAAMRGKPGARNVETTLAVVWFARPSSGSPGPRLVHQALVWFARPSSGSPGPRLVHQAPVWFARPSSVSPLAPSGFARRGSGEPGPACAEERMHMYVDIEAAKVPSARATAGTRRRRIRLIMLGYILVAPAVIWRLAVAIYPFLNTIWQSFTNNSPLAGTQRFIGLANFTRMFQDPVILQSLSFTFIFTAVSTAVQLVYAMGIALLLNKAFRGRGIVRAVNLLPWAMPAIVVATASQWMFNSQFGMIDDLIARVLPFRPIWLANPDLARIVVIILDVWKNSPWAALIILAGLQNIPRELYEAARVDGASAWRTFYSVVLPMLAPLIFTLLIFVSTYRVLTFDLVYGLTQGGPGHSTSLLSYQVYQLAFTGLYYGYGSAVAVFAFVIVLFLCVVFFLFMRRSEQAL